MKKILFAIASIALIFSACSNDDNLSGNPAEGQKAVLNIAINAPVMGTRATSALTADAVTNFTAFVINADGNIQATFTSADGTALTDQPVTTLAKQVYVVANAPTGLTATTKTELEAKLIDLLGTQFTSRTATGQTDTDLNFVQDVSGNYKATASVALKFVAARVTVKIVNGMTGYNAANIDGNLVLNHVALLNVMKESKLFGTSLVPATKSFYTGLTPVDKDNWPTAPVEKDELKDAIAANDFDATYHYYVFENDAKLANEFPTIVAIEGTFKKDKIYFPIHLAPYENWTTGATNASVERGKSYDITVTLKVDPTNPGGGSTPDPTDPVVTASVDISVTLTDWEPVVLGKEFN